MSLSSLIVQREIATIREIEEALARQVLYGGDFVTNLFEVSRIEEAALMPVVAESYGLPPAPMGELPKIPEEAVRLVAAEVAAERVFSPLELGSSLVVAVAAPLTKDAEQELAFALALPIEQRIAPLFRIRQALARDYGVPIDKRTARLITKIIHKGPKIASTFPPPIDSNPGFPLPARPPSIAPPPNRPPVTGASALAAAVAAAGPPGQATLVRTMEAPPARPPRRRRGPLTLDVAIAELEASAERDVIFDVLFEFARQFFDYTALFIVHGEIAEGRDAFGDGASREKVARIGVPLDLPSMLQRCRADKRVLRTRPAPDGIDPVLMGDLGREGGREGGSECIVFPIIVRNRVVALLFGDGGPSGIDDIGVRQVESLMDSAAGAFERVIMRRKLKGQDPGAAPGGVAGARLRAESVSPPPTQISAPPLTSTLVSERPAVEELAPPIRELLAEPVSRMAATRREPTPEAHLPEPSVVSDQPPPKNLLAVRRPSGQPIPREEPDSAGLSQSRPPQRTSQGPNRTASGSHKRAEAPPLEFGAPQVPSIAVASMDAPKTRRQTPAEFIPSWERESFEEGGAVSQAPYSPKAMSPPPMPAVRAEPPRSTTDPSPQPIDLVAAASAAASAIPVTPLAGGGGAPASTTDRSPPAIDFSVSPPIVAAPQPTATPAHEPRRERAQRLGTGTLLEGMSPPPLPLRDPIAQSAPISPIVVITPDTEMTPVGLGGEGGAGEGSDPVMALSHKRGHPPPVPEGKEPKPMPPSEQQVSVPAHKPPSSRSDHSRILPSVIVDMSSEFVTLVDRVLKGPDEEAETQLLRAGGYAMPAIMAKFPGPIVIEADRLASAPLPRVAECGPILRLVASQRRTALPFVLANVEHPDPERRFWSVYLLTELVYPDAIDAAIGRVFDADAKVRLAARAAARALAEAHPQGLVERIADVAKNEREPKLRRVQAIEALGETREPSAVGVLIPFLDDPSPDVTTASRTALVTIGRQDFGADGKRWAGWWEANKSRHRLEWLIDSLMHEQRSIRGLASDELRTLTKEYFGYYDDLPKRERERAQARYREWWESIGKVRFSRAATRGQ